ncbi:hypothetical protein D9M72_439600 [compost metagenome]
MADDCVFVLEVAHGLELRNHRRDRNVDDLAQEIHRQPVILDEVTVEQSRWRNHVGHARWLDAGKARIDAERERTQIEVGMTRFRARGVVLAGNGVAERETDGFRARRRHPHPQRPRSASACAR